MSLLVRLFDKLIFAAALIFALQGQQLLEHYQQFLSGYYESTKWQVEGYQQTAIEYQYSDMMAMIKDHQQNSSASVRADAEQKLVTIELYNDLAEGIAIFADHNLIDKTLFMLSPSRYQYLQKTLTNFTLGLPLSLNGWIFGLIFALLLNVIVSAITIKLPMRLIGKPISAK